MSSTSRNSPPARSFFGRRGYSVKTASFGLQCSSKTAVNRALSITPDATDGTNAVNSSGSKSGSQPFISKKVIAALAPTRLFPSINVVLAKVKQVSRGHRRDRGVKVLSAKRRLRRSQCRLQTAGISNAGRTAVPINLLLVNLQHFIQRKE